MGQMIYDFDLNGQALEAQFRENYLFVLSCSKSYSDCDLSCPDPFLCDLFVDLMEYEQIQDDDFFE